MWRSVFSIAITIASIELLWLSAADSCSAMPFT